MAEDTGVLFVAFGITGNLAVFVNILGKGGIVKHHTVFAFQVFLAGVERLGHHTVFGANLGHRTPALRLDEYLGLLAFVRTNLPSVEVVGTEVPFAIPAMLLHCLDHGVDSLLHAGCFIELSNLLAKRYVFLARNYEESCNHERFCFRAFADVLGSLETLVGIP